MDDYILAADEILKQFEDFQNLRQIILETPIIILHYRRTSLTFEERRSPQ